MRIMSGDRMKVWIRAVRPQFFTAAIVPILLGTSVAWHNTANFDGTLFCMALLGGLFIHTGLNLGNDYFDHKSGGDRANRYSTPFSGGSRVIQEGLIRPRQILWVSIFSFSCGSAIGLYLNAILPGNTILLIGVLGVFLAFFYTGDPIRIGYSRLGEAAVGLGFGPIMVLGSYYVQAHSLSWDVLWVSLPVGILIAAVLYINEFPDYEADKKVRKKTLVVILGKRKAIKIYYVLLGSTYLVTCLSVALKILPPLALIALGSFPLAYRAITMARKNYDKVYELLPANAATVALHMAFGLLLCGGYLLDSVA